MKKYTIHTTGAPGAKPRLRTALKLMGFETIRIDEAEIVPCAPKLKPDNLPTNEASLAVCALFQRATDKPWADEEIEAYRKATKIGLTAETVGEVARFYAKERRREGNYCRTSILTFLRHFGGELDKARADKPRAGKALEWAPANVVPMVDEAEAERIRTAALATAREFREGMGR